MDKKMAAQIFDTSEKNTKRFTLETPEKNNVEGFICKNRKFNMGSLIIDTVNGIETGQYVQGMPKITYLDNYTPIIKDPKAFRKADGSNMTIFPLIVDGDCKEVLFKTRGTPKVDKKLMKRTNLAVEEAHLKAVEYEKKSFSYEIYGYENPHEINYRFLDIPIKLDLLTVLEQGRSLPTSEMFTLAKRYGIDVIPQDFLITYDMDNDELRANVTKNFMDTFGEFVNERIITGFSIEDVYQEMQVFYEKINMAYQEKEKYGGIIVEGSVWHFGDKENYMIKNKAISVKEGHIKQACGIPHHDIRKAMLKAEDDGMDLEDKEKVFDYIKGELLEEYPENMVLDKKTKDKTLSILAKYTRKIEIDGNLQTMADAVIEKVGREANPSDKMRKFSEMFPDYKRLSSKMYQVFAQI